MYIAIHCSEIDKENEDFRANISYTFCTSNMETYIYLPEMLKINHLLGLNPLDPLGS